MKKQSTITQKGEIEFRKKLVGQQVHGKISFEDEFSPLDIEKILKERMEKTYNQIKDLVREGVVVSPYVEIGAERCQRSLVMENDIQAQGAAVDISFDMLKSADYYREKTNKKLNPLRICCDAYNLPFMSGSIPFVFCYETLHHFPELIPIINEIYRVLSPGGVFFFDEEPFKKTMHINLYSNKKAYSKSTLQRTGIKKLFDYFLAKNICNETEHNIIENESLSINEWEQALACFDHKEVIFKTPARSIRFSLSNREAHSIKAMIARLLGGTVTGQCVKRKTEKFTARTITDILICPSCKIQNKEVSLALDAGLLKCTGCHTEYPRINDVIMLFSKEKLKELYPEFC